MDGEPIDLALKDEMRSCTYCLQKDEIIFPSIESIRRTIVNNLNHNDNQQGAYGEFFILHEQGLQGPHIRIYKYEFFFEIIRSESYFLLKIIKEYPNIIKFTTCTKCDLKNLALNAFCNRCGNDIYDEMDFEFGPYGSMSFDI